LSRADASPTAQRRAVSRLRRIIKVVNRIVAATVTAIGRITATAAAPAVVAATATANGRRRVVRDRANLCRDGETKTANASAMLATVILHPGRAASPPDRLPRLGIR